VSNAEPNECLSLSRDTLEPIPTPPFLQVETETLELISRDWLYLDQIPEGEAMGLHLIMLTMHVRNLTERLERLERPHASRRKEQYG
jgi:hypothetical protein